MEPGIERYLFRRFKRPWQRLAIVLLWFAIVVLAIVIGARQSSDRRARRRQHTNLRPSHSGRGQTPVDRREGVLATRSTRGLRGHYLRPIYARRRFRVDEHPGRVLRGNDALQAAGAALGRRRLVGGW